MHTPLPWKYRVRHSGVYVDGPHDGLGTPLIAELLYRDGQGAQEANARFIVQAVNSHAALVEALRNAEWVQQTCNFAPECPWCGNYKEADHAKGCGYVAVLSAAGEEV
jgi:hypothetical protein